MWNDDYSRYEPFDYAYEGVGSDGCLEDHSPVIRRVTERYVEYEGGRIILRERV